MKIRFILFFVVCSSFAAALPTKLDLRNISGKSFVTSVKSQQGGTCWTFGVMGSLESNLLFNQVWTKEKEAGEPNLAEYHLDWWNGFNNHFNADIHPEKGKFPVHAGGDYKMAAAYFSRSGAVRDSDGQSFSKAPDLLKDTYHTYYVRDIEWMTAGPNLEKIDEIKQRVMDEGAVTISLAYDGQFYNYADKTFYQPPESKFEINHSGLVVGWDDEKKTKAPKPGAWLIKNSWGGSWGDKGFYWISYYDKSATQDKDLGAVSFRNTERLKYKTIYSHDYHGWVETNDKATEAFNAFVATGDELLRAVSVYTMEDDTSVIIKVFSGFEDGQLVAPKSLQEVKFKYRGFHTVDLATAVPLKKDDKFYVAVAVDKGGMALDKTSTSRRLYLGNMSREKYTITSKAKPGESFYLKEGKWVDLTTDDPSANFCIKALTTVD